MVVASWNALRRKAPPPDLLLLLTSALESRLWLMNASE